MSIIHEALKKVQSNRSETKTLKDPTIAAQPLVPAPKEQAPAPIKKPPTVMNIALWCILVIGVCGFTFYNLYEFIMRTTEMAVIKNASHSPQPAEAQTPAVVAPTPIVPQIKIKKGEILLSGIARIDGKDFALINKEFYQVGETVEGATITGITDDSVEISQKGKTRTIKVIRPDKI